MDKTLLRYSQAEWNEEQAREKREEELRVMKLRLDEALLSLHGNGPDFDTCAGVGAIVSEAIEMKAPLATWYPSKSSQDMLQYCVEAYGKRDQYHSIVKNVIDPMRAEIEADVEKRKREKQGL